MKPTYLARHRMWGGWVDQYNSKYGPHWFPVLRGQPFPGRKCFCVPCKEERKLRGLLNRNADKK